MGAYFNASSEPWCISKVTSEETAVKLAKLSACSVSVIHIVPAPPAPPLFLTSASPPFERESKPAKCEVPEIDAWVDLTGCPGNWGQPRRIYSEYISETPVTGDDCHISWCTCLGDVIQRSGKGWLSGQEVMVVRQLDVVSASSRTVAPCLCIQPGLFSEGIWRFYGQPYSKLHSKKAAKCSTVTAMANYGPDP